MSCSLLVAASLLFTDPSAATAPVAATVVEAPVSVAGEPMFADIVTRSGALKAIVDGWMATNAADTDGFFATTAFTGFKAQALDLAERDMAGHLVLKERGTDGDLKCILRGISEDMPKKIAAVEAAPTKAERDVALSELAYLLNDNVEVITAPPQPEV